MYKNNMSLEELKNYQYQLAQVKLALEKTPDDEELVKLSEDLEQVIELTMQLLPEEASQNQSVQKEKQKAKWKMGDVCEAKYQEDGRYYEAIIQTMAADRTFYTVLFTGYNETRNVTAKDLRPSTKRKAEAKEEPKEKQVANQPVEQKPKKKKVKVENPNVKLEEKKEKESLKKANSWKNFAAKTAQSSKTKHTISKSLFVRGEESARQMTAFKKPGKHVFKNTEIEEE